MSFFFFKKKLCERWAYKDNYTHHGNWLPTPPHTQKPKSCVTLHDGVATWQVGLGHLKNGHFLSLQIFNLLTNTRQILLLLCGAPSKLLLYPHLLLWKGPVIISKARKREDPAHFVVAAAGFQSWTLVCGCRVPYFFLVYSCGLQVFKSYHTISYVTITSLLSWQFSCIILVILHHTARCTNKLCQTTTQKRRKFIHS